jgi:hypothetical protein
METSCWMKYVVDQSFLGVAFLLLWNFSPGGILTQRELPCWRQHRTAYAVMWPIHDVGIDRGLKIIMYVAHEWSQGWVPSLWCSTLEFWLTGRKSVCRYYEAL